MVQSNFFFCCSAITKVKKLRNFEMKMNFFFGSTVSTKTENKIELLMFTCENDIILLKTPNTKNKNKKKRKVIWIPVCGQERQGKVLNEK